jgi:hypothetical protein
MPDSRSKQATNEKPRLEPPSRRGEETQPMALPRKRQMDRITVLVRNNPGSDDLPKEAAN